MINSPQTNNYVIEPGFICVPHEPMRLATVVASGVAITLYDRRLRLGGMAVYTHPIRVARHSTPTFAAPSITSLTKLLLDAGSRGRDLEAHLCGGAVLRTSPYYVPGQSEDNVRVGRELLRKLKIEICGEDVGGRRARKVMFHTLTGEIVVAKVDTVRRTDWYPPYDAVMRRRRELKR